MIEIGSSSCSSQLTGGSGAPGRDQLLVRIAGSAAVIDPDDVDGGLPERLDERRERVIDEQDAGTGVAEDVTDLGRGEARVDRDQHAPGERNGVMRLEHRRRIGREHGDAVAVSQAAVAQRIRETVAALLQFAVGDAPAVLVRHGDTRRVQIGSALQERDGRQLAAVDSGHPRTSTQR